MLRYTYSVFIGKYVEIFWLLVASKSLRIDIKQVAIHCEVETRMDQVAIRQYYILISKSSFTCSKSAFSYVLTWRAVWIVLTSKSNLAEMVGAIAPLI